LYEEARIKKDNAHIEINNAKIAYEDLINRKKLNEKDIENLKQKKTLINSEKEAAQKEQFFYEERKKDFESQKTKK